MWDVTSIARARLSRVHPPWPSAPASQIKPGPDGSKPLSYPILVQGVLDKYCVSCHRGKEADGGIALEGDPQGAFSVSYNTLIPLVSFSEVEGNTGGKFRTAHASQSLWGSCQQIDAVDRAGPRKASHFPRKNLERLITWMDANALFYGTFDPQDQGRQQRGERIEGPPLE